MDSTSQRPPLELWGGTECTINRVGDKFFSQLERNGHRHRLEDLDRFAQLGLRTLRFPILWEELAPASPDAIDWTRVDGQLLRMRELGIRAIAGLVHHGSGPAYTSLIDPEFPVKLARFARQVAERYPWIDAFTPVNEPLTTARFSGLYGHWHPHGHDGFTFAHALINQCRGVVLAMRAIREVNPAAALVQTDDLGKIYSRSKLSYQADFENERRWITWDLLCGRVDRAHSMWSYFEWVGIDPRRLEIFQEGSCTPDIVGVNHYITSDRFLDDDLRHYPSEMMGGNGRDRYADVAAVRVRPEGITGPAGILREACLRYGQPVAVTEAHLGCTREEQLRWFLEIWNAARALRNEGHTVCAVTAWSLLGAFDWNSLLTRRDGHYEPGAFDLRSDPPRATAVAKLIGGLAKGNCFEHPVLATPGWWHRTVRLASVGAERSATEATTPSISRWSDSHELREPRPILITGGAGRLAGAFATTAELRGLCYRALARAELDIADRTAVDEALRAFAPWAVINCAGFAGIDAAEDHEIACARSNTQGPENLAIACARSRTALVTFSSDFVFDGRADVPYIESDATEGLNVYGESKAASERKVLSAFPGALILRLGKILAPIESENFLRPRLMALARGEHVLVANDIKFSMTSLPDFVHATLDLLIDGECGLWHLANLGATTPEEALRLTADLMRVDTSLLKGVPLWALRRPALRPRFRALASERGQLLPSLEEAVRRYAREAPPIREEAGALIAAS